MASTRIRPERKTNRPPKVDNVNPDGCTLKPLEGKSASVTDCQSNCECLCASDESIRMLAYLKWEAAGCPPDHGLMYWLEAEGELDATRSGAGSA